MKVFAKFDEIPFMTLQDIKETKYSGHTFVRTDGRTDGRTTWGGGYKNFFPFPRRLHMKLGFDWPSGFRVEDV